MSSSAFSYAIVRVVPDLERGEFVNVGVILHARQHDFLAARIELNAARLAAIAPQFDAEVARSALSGFAKVAAGDADGGAMAKLDKSERFGWLVAPSSTVVQCSAVHTGLCDDPQRALDELFEDLAR